MADASLARALELIIRTRSKIGVVEIDASVQEVHSRRAVATSHPVEAEPGLPSEISDNVKLEPPQIRLQGVVTNHPATVEGSAQNAIARLVEGGDYDPAGDAYSQFKEYLMKAKEITVVTTLETYYDMVFETLDVDRGASRGNAIFFSAVLTQVTKVRLKEQTVKVKLPDKSQKAKGKKAGQAAKNETVVKGSALKKRIVDTGGYDRAKSSPVDFALGLVGAR